MKVKQMLAYGAVAIAMSLGVFAIGSGTALAPGPAKLRTALGPSSGATASAVIVNTSIETKVLYYSSSWTSDPTGPAAGTPCSTIALAIGAKTQQIMQARGSYRRCG